MLKEGDRGQQARQLQELLQAAGIDPGGIDGIVGPTTAAAVRAFQARNGLVADGVVGPSTWAALQGEGPSSRPRASGARSAGAPTLTALESPGGGRITDKRDPDPADVVSVPGRHREIRLHRLAAEHWIQLMAEARAAGIADPLLLTTSGYRSRASQERAWERAKKKYGSEQEARKWVAPPGDSAHQSGRALDCYLGMPNASENAEALRRTDAHAWLVVNAEGYGFFPYEREPWHWEYNPKEKENSSELR